MVLKERELVGHNACPTRRMAGLSVSGESSTQIFKGNIVRTVILGYLVEPKKFLDWDAVEEYVETQLQEETAKGSFISSFHREEVRKEILKTSKRFVDWALSQGFQCQEAVTKEVKVGDLTVSVSPAWVQKWHEGPEEEGYDMVEVAKLSSQKVKLTTGGRTADTSVKMSLQMYALIQYGKTLLPDGGRIRVAYYYTKKKTGDSEFTEPYSERDFVGYIEVSYDPTEILPKWEEKYLLSASEFSEGHTCTKSACEDCEFHSLCTFVKPPVAIEKHAEAEKESSYRFTGEQLKIISFKEGCGRANCGAGAGKTTVVVHRVISLLNHGVHGDEILLITFTNTGCKEMMVRLKRAAKYAGVPEKEVSKVKITTFNGLGDEILHRYWEDLGYALEPILADKVDKMDLILQLFAEVKVAGLDYRYPLMDKPNCQGAYAKMFHIFSTMKSRGIETVKAFLKEFPEFTGMEESIGTLMEQYKVFCEEMKVRGLFEYADQEQAIFGVLEKKMFLFAEDYNFAHVIVDEFQDSNALQLEIIKAVCDTDWFESLLVVGDDSQAIFGFRGTSPYNIINFPSLIGMDVQDFYLVDNYRSTPEIIGAANYVNSLNEHRIKKNLVSKRASGSKPVLKGFDSDKSEMLWTASQIERLVKEEGVQQSDICYIARTKSELGRMQTELTNRGIVSVLDVPEPILKNSRVLAGIELAQYFMDASSTKSLLVYLDAVMDNEYLSLGSVKGQALLDSNVKEFELCFDNMKEEERIDYFLSLLEVLNDGDELYETFFESVKKHRRYSLSKLLDYILKFKLYDSDLEGRHSGDFDAVKLTTTHSSKGLEWNHVFVTLTKYDEPGRSATSESIEEDRRLMFVAFTRARDELYVTSTFYAGGSKDAVGRRLHRYFSELRRYDGFDYEYRPDEAVVPKKKKATS